MSGDEIAYRDLEPGEPYQDGDEWQSERRRWIEYSADAVGTPHDGDRRSRRPYNITQMLQQRAELTRLNEDLNHEVQTLRPLVEGLEQRCEQLQAALEAARTAPDFAEGVAEVLRRLEIAAEAMHYLAEVGINDEVGYSCGFGAAIAVVKNCLASDREVNRE